MTTALRRFMVEDFRAHRVRHQPTRCPPAGTAGTTALPHITRLVSRRRAMTQGVAQEFAVAAVAGRRISQLL
jgi:hypothetical protein